MNRRIRGLRTFLIERLGRRRWWAAFLWLAPAMMAMRSAAAGDAATEEVTNTFPSVAEVIGGKTFGTFTDQDIYFIRSIHDRYHDHWSDLLAVNITLNDYVLTPEKLLRFVNELGEAMRDRDDTEACASLYRIVNEPAFYADSGSYRPQIVQAAARALIKIGPKGCQMLASAFSTNHYCADAGSLEDLAKVIGSERPAGPEFVQALSATGFGLCTSNGAYYSRCTTTAVKNLLNLTGGSAAVRKHLTAGEMLANPGRFEAVMEGVGAADASELATNLTEVLPKIHARLLTLTDPHDGYRADLFGLEVRLQATVAVLAGKKGSADPVSK